MWIKLNSSSVNVLISTQKWCSVHLYHQLFAGELVAYLRNCVSLRIMVSSTYYVRCVFVLLFSVLSPVSLDCSFLIVSSVFANVYFSDVHMIITFLMGKLVRSGISDGRKWNRSLLHVVYMWLIFHRICLDVTMRT